MNAADTLDLPMSPPREERRVNAERLSFPLPMVVAIVGTALAVSGGEYVANASMRSDVRDISTRIELQSKLKDERDENFRAAMTALSDQVKELRGESKLLQLQYQQIQLEMTKKAQK